VLLKTDPTGFEIVTVQSGVCSLHSKEFDETFHPVIGPMAEAVALHVRQQRLVERAAAAVSGSFVIWDVGLGAAANAIAAIEAFEGKETCIELHSFDVTSEPLRFALNHAAELGYIAPHTTVIEELLATGAASSAHYNWRFHQGDFRETISAVPPPHAVLYDPYSPQSNPEMWTLEQFARVRAGLSPAAPCLLTNYTRSTAVRVTLLLAGFFVGRGHATGEKDQTTIATNDLALLEDPLDADWLGRVRRSTNGAPLREGRSGWETISDTDWATLLAHPQFAR